MSTTEEDEVLLISTTEEDEDWGWYGAALPSSFTAHEEQAAWAVHNAAARGNECGPVLVEVLLALGAAHVGDRSHLIRPLRAEPPSLLRAPLMSAVDGRQAEVASLLIEGRAQVDAQDPDGYTALARAVAMGREGATMGALLCEAGASLEYANMLILSDPRVRAVFRELCGRYRKGWAMEASVVSAARAGNMPCFRHWLAKQPSADELAEALCVASRHGRPRAVRLILKAHPAIGAADKGLALRLALESDQSQRVEEVAEMLIDAGATWTRPASSSLSANVSDRLFKRAMISADGELSFLLDDTALISILRYLDFSSLRTIKALCSRVAALARETILSGEWRAAQRELTFDEERGDFEGDAPLEHLRVLYSTDETGAKSFPALTKLRLRSSELQPLGVVHSLVDLERSDHLSFPSMPLATARCAAGPDTLSPMAVSPARGL